MAQGFPFMGLPVGRRMGPISAYTWESEPEVPAPVWDSQTRWGTAGLGSLCPRRCW